MNVWQVAKQLRHLLRSRSWPGGGPVFGSVFVTVRPPEEPFEHSLFPMCLLGVGSGDTDPEHDDEHQLISQRFPVRVAVAIPYDGIGESSILGANRTLGDVTSLGRGLLEVEEQLFDTVAEINGIDGVELHCKLRSAVEVDNDQEVGYIALREYLLEVLTTENRFYHPPTRLTGADLTGGSASISWRLPPDRFDRVRMILRRAVGATPPATATSGTDVPLGTPLATSVTDSPGAGTYSYAIFAAYDEYNEPPTADQRFSDQTDGSVISGLVVT